MLHHHASKEATYLHPWLLFEVAERGINFLIFWLCCASCDILVLQPGTEPMPPALAAQIQINGFPGKPWGINFLKHIL